MSDKIKSCLAKIDSSLFGEPVKYTKSALGSVCDTSSDWKDVLSVYLSIENDIIVSMGAKCGPCDPHAYITLYALMKTLPGISIKNLDASKEELKRKFVKECEIELEGEILAHYDKIFRVVSELVNDYRNSKPVCQCKINLK
ncbi:MAG: hypothetical protein AB7T10_07525 [bacterium]